MTDEVITIIEAMAWTRKYLIVNSRVIEFSLLIRIGVKLIKLISNPTQAKIHEDEEHARIVPNITAKI